jgi:release factor glutamine methyltransferase
MSEVWTLGRVLTWTTQHFEQQGLERPRLNAEWLLCAATKKSRVELYTAFDEPLTQDELTTMREGIKRRDAGEPLQYVTGEMPFRHIVLACTPQVLIPRPETELLVDEVLSFIGSDPARVLEVGAGTGCICCSIAHEAPQAQVVATDCSPQAVALATRNAQALSLEDRVHVVECDLVAGISQEDAGTFDVLVSNPPYIPTAVVATLPREVEAFEPHLALDGGEDGLDIYRRLLAEALPLVRPGGLFAVELFEGHLEQAAELARACPALSAASVRVVQDLAGKPRLLIAQRASA